MTTTKRIRVSLSDTDAGIPRRRDGDPSRILGPGMAVLLDGSVLIDAARLATLHAKTECVRLGLEYTRALRDVERFRDAGASRAELRLVQRRTRLLFAALALAKQRAARPGEVAR